MKREHYYVDYITNPMTNIRRINPIILVSMFPCRHQLLQINLNMQFLCTMCRVDKVMTSLANCTRKKPCKNIDCILEMSQARINKEKRLLQKVVPTLRIGGGYAVDANKNRERERSFLEKKNTLKINEMCE